MEDGKVLGGARIQIADDKLPLPIEDAVGIVDQKIHQVVEEHKKGLTGEICGLWNSREIAGYGIGSIYLGWSGVALSRILGMNTLFALCAPATVRPCKQVGFVIERSLGSNGYFNYPKLNLVATAMVIPDVQVLSSAMDIVRTTVGSLFENPEQTITFESPKGPYQHRIRFKFKPPKGVNDFKFKKSTQTFFSLAYSACYLQFSKAQYTVTDSTIDFTLINHAVQVLEDKTNSRRSMMSCKNRDFKPAGKNRALSD